MEFLSILKLLEGSEERQGANTQSGYWISSGIFKSVIL